MAQQTRLDVLRLLSSDGPMAASAIADRLAILRLVMSAHLKVLAQAGLVRGERTGRTITYHLLGDRIAEVARTLREIAGR